MSSHATKMALEVGLFEKQTQSEADAPAHEEKVSVLAYRIWQERGCRVGSSETDWFKAEQELQR